MHAGVMLSWCGILSSCDSRILVAVEICTRPGFLKKYGSIG